MPLLTSRIFLATLSVPTAAVLLTAYFHSHPLPAAKSRTITTYNDLPPTHYSSPSLRIVNPRSHQAMVDTRTIFLSKNEIGELSDVEILARFVKGYYGGWVFMPELGLGKVAHTFGTSLVNVGYSDLEPLEEEIWSPSDLSSTSLPPKRTRLIKGGIFMILDHHISSAAPSDAGKSFVEIGFGDDRATFAGMKRFEIFRQEGEEGVLIADSSVACNPSVNRRIAPWAPHGLMKGFHNLYAQYLFRDAVREVLDSV